MKERRLVRVAVSFDLLRDMMDEDYATSGAIKTIKGIPSDAVMITDGFDNVRQEAYLFFYHKSFDVVSPGEVVPSVSVSHSIDLAPFYLLRRWYEGLENIRTRDDALLDAIVGVELDKVFQDTKEYLKD